METIKRLCQRMNEVMTYVTNTVDAEYMITRQQDSRFVSVKGTKMKDADRPKPKNFELQIINLGVKDNRDREVTSAVLQETDQEVMVPEKNS